MKPSLKFEVLGELQEMHSDTTKAHRFDFYLYFPSRHSAETAAEKIRESEFLAKVEPGASGDNWLCRASIKLVPADAPLDEIGKFFDQVAGALHGDFDGWESDVIEKGPPSGQR